MSGLRIKFPVLVLYATVGTSSSLYLWDRCFKVVFLWLVVLGSYEITVAGWKAVGVLDCFPLVSDGPMARDLWHTLLCMTHHNRVLPSHKVPSTSFVGHSGNFVIPVSVGSLFQSCFSLARCFVVVVNYCGRLELLWCFGLFSVSVRFSDGAGFVAHFFCA